jgi:phasin
LFIRRQRRFLGWGAGRVVVIRHGSRGRRIWGLPFCRPDRKGFSAMEDTTTKVLSSTKPAIGFSGSAFEFPKFAMPNFELPKMEIPAAFREFAEKGVSQAKENYEKMKSAAEEATDLLEGTYATASKGASEYGLKMIEAARSNTNATFDFVTELMGAKSVSEFVELSTGHARKQFEALTAQSKELAALAQKVAVDTAEPVKESVNKAFKKVA